MFPSSCYCILSRRQPFCLIVVALAAATVPVSKIHGQEVDSLPAVEEEGGLHISVLPGVHGAIVRQGSPSSLGASLDVVLDSPKRPIWVSLQYLSQAVQWNVQYDDNTRRDHHYAGRVRLGLGRRQGPRIYALFEKGRGVVKADPSLDPEDKYDLQGFGLGAGLAVSRFTVAFEAVVGLADKTARGGHYPPRLSRSNARSKLTRRRINALYLEWVSVGCSALIAL